MRHQSIHLIVVSYLCNNKGWVFQVGKAEVGKGPARYCLLSTLLYFSFCKWSAYVISTYLSLYFPNPFHIFYYSLLYIFPYLSYFRDVYGRYSPYL